MKTEAHNGGGHILALCGALALGALHTKATSLSSPPSSWPLISAACAAVRLELLWDIPSVVELNRYSLSHCEKQSGALHCKLQYRYIPLVFIVPLCNNKQ